MEFISAEEFLKQPKEVQEIFIDWWKPTEFDLYLIKEDLSIHRVCKSDIEDYKNNELYNIKSEYCIPSLIEGQLRQFIEDKTRCYFSCNIINLLATEEGFRFVFEFYSVKEFKYNEKLRKEIYAIDLLQAYWKVACEIAKEIVEGDKDLINK